MGIDSILATVDVVKRYLRKDVSWRDAMVIGGSVAAATTAYHVARHMYLMPRNCAKVPADLVIPYVPKSICKMLSRIDVECFGIQHLSMSLDPDDLVSYRKTIGSPTFSAFPLVSPMPAVFITDPQNVQHVLSTNFSNWQKTHVVKEKLEDFAGDNFFALDGDAWKRQRKLISSVFSQSCFRDFMFVSLVSRTEKLASVLTKQHNCNETVKFYDLASRFTRDSIFQIGLDRDHQAVEIYPCADVFGDCVHRAFLNYIHRFSRPWWKLEKMFNIGPERQARQDRKLARETILNAVKEARQRHQSGYEGKDFVSTFLSSHFNLQTNDPYLNLQNDEFLVDIFVGLLVAGEETTGSALSWMFFELAQHPRVLAKAREEIQEILGDDVITFEDISKFKYLTMIQNESMRLHPPVPTGARIAVDDDTFPDGTVVKGGTVVMYSAYVIGRDPDVWGEDCDEFIPERWENVDTTTKAFPFQFPVFHAGPRTCVAKRMAYMEMTVVMAELLPLFDFKLACAPGQVQTTDGTGPLDIENGLPMRFSPRRSAVPVELVLSSGIKGASELSHDSARVSSRAVPVHTNSETHDVHCEQPYTPTTTASNNVASGNTSGGHGVEEDEDGDDSQCPFAG